MRSSSSARRKRRASSTCVASASSALGVSSGALSRCESASSRKRWTSSVACSARDSHSSSRMHSSASRRFYPGIRASRHQQATWEMQKTMCRDTVGHPRFGLQNQIHGASRRTIGIFFYRFLPTRPGYWGGTPNSFLWIICTPTWTRKQVLTFEPCPEPLQLAREKVPGPNSRLLVKSTSPLWATDCGAILKEVVMRLFWLSCHGVRKQSVLDEASDAEFFHSSFLSFLSLLYPLPAPRNA